jgi:hypothetical protein
MDALEPTFHLGQRVRANGRDYQFEGTIQSVFRKRSDQIRYVVEDDRGVLLVHSGRTLEEMP